MPIDLSASYNHFAKSSEKEDEKCNIDTVYDHEYCLPEGTFNLELRVGTPE